MLINPYRFHKINSTIKPVKLLNDYEKIKIIEMFRIANAQIYTIYIDDLICIELNAKIDDIICLQNCNNEIYRRVIIRR